MSSLFHNNLGFYKIPITKTLLCSVVVSSSALNFPLFHGYRQLIIANINDIIFRFKFWRIFASKLAFCDTKDLVFGSILLYYLRIFERRFGSHKYSSYLLATFTISALLEVAMIALINHFNLTNIQYLSSGPFNIIFALFVNYYFDVPNVSRSRLMGIPISAKSLTYFIGFQAMISSNSALVCAIAGLLSGVVYRWNVFCVQDLIRVPQWVASIAHKVFARLVCSSPPAEPTIQMGATLEIQRQQQMELMEQQMLYSRFREFNANNGMNLSPNRRRNNLNGDHSPLTPQASTSTNTEYVTALVEMGFDRESAVRALQRSNNDMTLATNILLSES